MYKSDTFLIELLKQGDCKAFSIIAKQFLSELYSLAYTFLGDKMEAENIVQDGLVVLWERRKAFSSLQDAKRYLRTVVKNKSVDFIKSTNRKKRVLNEFNYLNEHQTIIHDISQQEKEYVIEILGEGIQNLPSKTKQILTLSLAGKSAKEISELMKIERKAIHKIKARGVTALRKVVESRVSTKNY